MGVLPIPPPDYIYKNDDVPTILKSLTMATLSVADGSYTNL